MSPVSRETTAGRVYLELQALARRTGRPTQELLVGYVLERFLYRLSCSPYRDRLVLKGGMLLAAWESRRPTADVDLLAQAVSNEVEAVADTVRAVLAVDADDGVRYEPDRLATGTIRDAEMYAGVRVSVPARVERARAVLRIDVNVGDPVTPGPVHVQYPGLLAGSFTLLGYPLATVLAEKIVTMIDRGAATTRERDFADVALLIRRHAIDAAEIRAALQATARHRGSELRPLAGLLDGLGPNRQGAWSAYLTRSGLADALPTDYTETITAVAAFADPLLSDPVSNGRWDPATRRWA